MTAKNEVEWRKHAPSEGVWVLKKVTHLGPKVRGFWRSLCVLFADVSSLAKGVNQSVCLQFACWDRVGLNTKAVCVQAHVQSFAAL